MPRKNRHHQNSKKATTGTNRFLKFSRWPKTFQDFQDGWLQARIGFDIFKMAATFTAVSVNIRNQLTAFLLCAVLADYHLLRSTGGQRQPINCLRITEIRVFYNNDVTVLDLLEFCQFKRLKRCIKDVDRRAIPIAKQRKKMVVRGDTYKQKIELLISNTGILINYP